MAEEDAFGLQISGSGSGSNLGSNVLGGSGGTAEQPNQLLHLQQQNQQQQHQSPEKLLLSFENPNYQLERQFKSMDQARIDDHLNSNVAPNMYEELCRELKIYTELSGKKVIL